jgi:hypothetical protein
MPAAFSPEPSVFGSLYTNKQNYSFDCFFLYGGKTWHLMLTQEPTLGVPENRLLKNYLD